MDVRDGLVRHRAFEFLDRLRSEQGEALDYRSLSAGLSFEGVRVPLLGPQGIFKPRILPQLPLSIATAPQKAGKARPYADEIGEDGFIRYRYRGVDPGHRDNVGLRTCWQRRVPLVYLYGLVPGKYCAAYPIFIVGDDPARLTFLAQLDQIGSLPDLGSQVGEDLRLRREYITVAAKRRIHQERFRERVLSAYRRCCAMCSLRHEPLLDAAHIFPDSHTEGEPVVSNGLALCKIHHAAFDGAFLGVRPDLRIEVARRILDEEDGPMLLHGLQGLHGTFLQRPTRTADRPNPKALAYKYERFLATG